MDGCRIRNGLQDSPTRDGSVIYGIGMTRFIISAIGSYGDVHPMIGLGSALAGRGHEVKLITNPYFAELVKSAGLDLLPIGTREKYIEAEPASRSMASDARLEAGA